MDVLILRTASIAFLAAFSMPAQNTALLNQYCVTCHNSKAKVGGLALDTADLNNVPAHAEMWEEVTVESSPPPASCRRSACRSRIKPKWMRWRRFSRP